MKVLCKLKCQQREGKAAWSQERSRKFRMPGTWECGEGGKSRVTYSRPAQPGKVNGQGSRKGPFVSELLHSVPGLFSFLYLVF